jgi:hypothetical protein
MEAFIYKINSVCSEPFWLAKSVVFALPHRSAAPRRAANATDFVNRVKNIKEEY